MLKISNKAFQAFEKGARQNFCKTSLQDLKQDGFLQNLDDQDTLEELINISKKLEASGLLSQSLQYRYFMYYSLFRQQFRDNPSMHYHTEQQLKQLTDDYARSQYLDGIIDKALGENEEK